MYGEVRFTFNTQFLTFCSEPSMEEKSDDDGCLEITDINVHTCVVPVIITFCYLFSMT